MTATTAGTPGELGNSNMENTCKLLNVLGKLNPAKGKYLDV